jgi:hypothetical protein
MMKCLYRWWSPPIVTEEEGASIAGLYFKVRTVTASKLLMVSARGVEKTSV